MLPVSLSPSALRVMVTSRAWPPWPGTDAFHLPLTSAAIATREKTVRRVAAKINFFIVVNKACAAVKDVTVSAKSYKCAINAIISYMATILIRRLDESTKARLRIRAAQHGRSMEEEAREILRQAVATLDANQPN